MSDINVTTNAQDSLFEAVDYIITDSIARTPKDITLDGIITDVSNKANYRYRVKTNESEFDAYALQGTSYYKNDSVLIHVPMGDFSNQKTILSRKSDGDAVNEIFAFKLPFDDFIGLRDLNQECNFEDSTQSFWANFNINKYANVEPEANDLSIMLPQQATSNLVGEELLWHWNYGQANSSTTIGNTRLGIEADWQTFLGDYNPIAGVYGFRIVVQGRAVNQESILTKEYFFTNKDMYGNTYAFYTPYSQQKVFDISDFCNIYDIKIYFYQDYGFMSANTHVGLIWYNDFVSSDNGYIPADPENILVNNIKVFLGISTEDIKDEKTYLYSYDPLQYTTIEERKITIDNVDSVYTQTTEGEWIKKEYYFNNDEQNIYSEDNIIQVLFRKVSTDESLTEEKRTKLLNIINKGLNNFTEEDFIDLQLNRKIQKLDELNNTIQNIEKEYICTSKHDLIFTWVHYAKDQGMSFDVVKNKEDLNKQRESSKKDTHIYWYRYNYDEELKTSNLRFFPAQDENYNFNTEDNNYHKNYQEMYDNLRDAQESHTYTSKIQLYGGEGWTFIPGLTDSFNWDDIQPRADKSREKIKVVVQHHGTHTTSEILILENTRDIESELAQLTRNDMFLIKCFKVREVDDVLTAIEDSSLNAFHIYDENNHILHNDQGERYDYEKLYLQIHIKDEDTGTYRLLNTFDEVNGTNLDRIITWLIPDNYTMIESQYPITPTDASYFTSLQFRDKSGNVSFQNPEDIDIESPEYKNFYAATKRFTIKSILNNRYQNNIVNAIITYNKERYYLQKDLMFGRAEGEGHEFLPVLELIQPYNATSIVSGQPFMIGCTVYNKDGTIVRPSNTNLIHFTWKELGGYTKFINVTAEEEESIKAGSFETNKNQLINNYITFENKLDDQEVNKEALRAKYAKYENNVVCGIIVPENIGEGENSEYIGYSPIFEVTVSGAADYDIIVRKAFSVITLQNAGVYDQSYSFTVPDRIEFKSDGMNPIYYDSIFSVQKNGEEQYKFKIVESGQKLDETFVGDEWSLITNDDSPIFKLKIEQDSSKILTNSSSSEDEETTSKGYTQKLKHYYTYKLAPVISSNDSGASRADRERISWNPELLNKYYYLTWKDKTIHFTQALAFHRNLYSSSLVNEWDGTTLTWDDETGSVLSTMIAAGTKDNHNKFTGVMMGDWHTKGDESLDTPGMYGYKDGAQTFGFKTDGTGFIGSAGSGRIEFDGKNALISNSQRTCYMNLNPGADRGYSDNFIYCQIPRSAENESNFNTESSGIEYETSWANSYVKDTDNDYFIVDPTHGILTTGGLVARYGKIGNWMINNEGLYQTTNNGYMYLGFDESDINITTIFKTMKNDLEITQNNIKSNINNIIKYNNNTLTQCYYNDLLQKLNQSFSEKILTDDFELLIKEEQDKINNNNNLITNTYNIDKNWISTGKKENEETQLLFNILYDIYIKDNSLNYYNLKDKLKELLALYDTDLIFNTLIEYLDSFNNNKDNNNYSLYKNFISTLEVYPSHQYEVKLKQYDKYVYDKKTDTHIKESVEEETVNDDIDSYNIYLDNITLKEAYIKALNQFQSKLNDINSNIDSVNIQLENDIAAFLNSNTSSFDETDQEKFNEIVNQLTLLDNIQHNFSLQSTNYNNLLSEINILISDKELIMVYYNNLSTVQQDIIALQESIDEYDEPIANYTQQIANKDAEIEKEKDKDKLTILQTERQQLEDELTSLQTSQDQFEFLQESKIEDEKTIKNQIEQLLRKYNIALDPPSEQDDVKLPKQDDVRDELNLKIGNMIQSNVEQSDSEEIQFNEYSDIFELLILNNNENKEIDSIEELWQQINNSEDDDFIANLLNQYQSFKNENGTLNYNFKTIQKPTDSDPGYTEIEENIITNNANILQQCENNLNIINQILVRKRQLIFNNYSSVDIPEWITTNQNTFSILRDNYITIQNKINEINNDLVYINKIYDFYNTLLLVIDKKISLLKSNNTSYQKNIDIRISDLMITFDAIVNILFNDTIGIVSTTNIINTYIQKINEQQQTLINTNIYTLDECNNYIKDENIYQWKALDWNQFNEQVIQQSIKEDLQEFKEEFRTLLLELKLSVLNQMENKEIEQKKNNIKNKYKEFYESLLLKMDENTRKVNIKDSTKNTYNNILNNIINNIQNILLNRINDYLNTLSATTTYAIYVSDIDPNTPAATPNPYFSVSRDGTMFSQKGIIANTWIIDDCSLTYKENFAKLYLGKGDNKSNNGVALNYTLPEGMGWSISAGEINQDNNNYNINFGVTIDGQLYSNVGQIGKWYISDHTLQGKPKNSSIENGNYLILDAKDNTIKAANEAFIIDGSKGEIYLGRYLTHITQTTDNEETVTYIDTVIGNMYLASFLMSGRTVFKRDKDNEDIDFDYIKRIITSQSTQNTSVGGSTENYGWGTVSLGSETIGASTGVSSQHISYGLDVNNCSYLQFLDKNHDYKGAILAVGKNSQDSTGMEENVTVFYPASSQHSVLGINTRRWDLFANYIDVDSLYAVGINCKEEIRMLEGELVATQPWVRDQLYDLWNAIGDLNNAAGAASRKSNAQSIIGAQWIGKQGSNGGYCIGIRFTRGNNSTFDSNTSGELSGAYHGHRIELKRVGTSLQATATTYSGTGSTAYGPALSIDHTHPLTGSFSDGTFTVQLGGADFNKTMSSPYKYDVRTSAWYSGRLQHLWSGIAIGSGTGPNSNAKNASIKIILKRNSVDGISFSDRTVYSANGALASYYQNAYDTGYKKGWNACIDNISSWPATVYVSCEETCTCGETVTCTGSTTVTKYSIPSKK